MPPTRPHDALWFKCSSLQVPYPHQHTSTRRHRAKISCRHVHIPHPHPKSQRYGWVCCARVGVPDWAIAGVAAHGQVSDTFIGKQIRLVSGATASTTSHPIYFKLTAPHPSGQLSSTGTPNYPPPISPSPCPFSPGVNSVYSLKACGLVCPIFSVAGWARYGLRPVGKGPAGPSHPGLGEQGLASAPWAGALSCSIFSCQLSKVRPPPRGRGPCRARAPRAGWAGFGLRPMGGGPAMPNLFMQAEQGMAFAPWAGALPGPATQGWLSRAWPTPRGRGPCQVQSLVPAEQGMAFSPRAGPAVPSHPGLVVWGVASALWAGDAPCAATSVSIFTLLCFIAEYAASAVPGGAP